MKLVLGVTCYNRLNYIKEFFQSWQQTKSDHNWLIIIADDGSNEEQITYIESIQADKVLIKNNKRGVAYQTNCILRTLENIEYDICFKCDDDIIFSQKGWDSLYIDTVMNTEYKHICYDNKRFMGKWCKDGLIDPPKEIMLNNRQLRAYVRNDYIRGCFYTITPEIQRRVGFMDVKNFFHGHEHTDYSQRCARAGFNDRYLAFDCVDSDKYINYRFLEDVSSMNSRQYAINGNGIFSNTIKRKKLQELERIYVPFEETNRRIRTDILMI